MFYIQAGSADLTAKTVDYPFILRYLPPLTDYFCYAKEAIHAT